MGKRTHTQGGENGTRRRDLFAGARRTAGSAIDEYFREVSRHEPMSREEEVEVARRARAGDQESLEQLMRANLRFAISVAKKYQGRGLPLSDLIQAANLGLVRAALKFDPERGVKFISYAVWWIRQAIQSTLAHHGRPIRLPVNRAAQLAAVLKASERLKERLGRDPSAEEIARETDIGRETVETLATLNAGEVRLDLPIGEDGGSTIGERVPAEEELEAGLEDVRMREQIQEALGTLRERDARVLRLYYGLGGEREHTLAEIGDILGISRERVRQLRDRALSELREGAQTEILAALAG